MPSSATAQGKSRFPGAADRWGKACGGISHSLWGAGCRGPDARGMAVTPGFIDAHRHCDLAALYDPEFGRLELAQGITTAVMGNCGLAPAPCTEEYRDRLYDFWSPVWAQLPKTVFPSGFGVFPGTGDKAVSAEPGSIRGPPGPSLQRQRDSTMSPLTGNPDTGRKFT